MTDRLRIHLRDEEGALLRLLGTVERRGYRLLRVEAEGGRLALELAARDPARRLDVLAAQLRRLHDVTDVHAYPAMQSAA
jgi:acetolactate synthase II small subunit